MSTRRALFPTSSHASSNRGGVRRWCSAAVLAAVASLAGAQKFPSSGDLLSLYAPAVLAGGRSVTAVHVPVAHAINPALTGADERISFDFGYIALLPTRSGEAGLGSAVNAAATLPTKIGVWGFSAHYFGSELDKLQIGPLGALHASFAKELYSNFYLGAGLGLQVGEDPLAAPEDEQQWLWGGGLDVGFLHRPGTVGPIKDMAWGMAMRGIGKSIAEPDKDYRVYAPAFTPALGVSLTPLHTPDIAFSTSFDLWAPTFQALRAEVGAGISISDFLRIHAYYPFALVGSHDGEDFSPRFGFSLRFGFGLPESMQVVGYGARDWSRGEIAVHTAAGPLKDQIWGLGLGTTVSLGALDDDPPEVSIDSDEVEYRSPNLDGVQDDLTLPISITDSGIIAGYVLMIEDEGGNLVRTIRNKDGSPDAGGLEGAVDRLLSSKEQIDIPASPALGRQVVRRPDGGGRRLPLLPGGVGRQRKHRAHPAAHRRHRHRTTAGDVARRGVGILAQRRRQQGHHHHPAGFFARGPLAGHAGRCRRHRGDDLRVGPRAAHHAGLGRPARRWNAGRRRRVHLPVVRQRPRRQLGRGAAVQHHHKYAGHADRGAAHRRGHLPERRRPRRCDQLRARSAGADRRGALGTVGAQPVRPGGAALLRYRTGARRGRVRRT